MNDNANVDCMMPPHLLSLPYEVIIEFLSYLYPQDLVACQRSCRQLNDIIIHSHLLYVIRLRRSGLHDPLLPGYTIPQRIEALGKWEAAWRNLDDNSPYHVKHKVPCRVTMIEPLWISTATYRIHDDFLLAVNWFKAPGYAYVDLRTFQSEGGEQPWTKITNDNWHAKKSLFVFSPEQDLVLVVLWPARHTSSMFIELHGISFSHGTPHPYVVSATIPTKELHKCEVTDAVIVGGHTILSVSSTKSRSIFLHSWKDGHVYLLREASKPIRWLRFETLSRDMIALLEAGGTELELCRIVKEPDSGAPYLCTLIRLGLPPLAPQASIVASRFIRESVAAYSDVPSFAIEDRPPRRFPFRNSPESGLLLIILTVRDKSAGKRRGTYPLEAIIVTHLRTLVALATTTSPGVTFIPWENWGPRVTACFKHIPHPHHYVPMGERLARLSTSQLFLYDFNSSRIEDTILRSDNSSGRDGRVTTVKHRSVIPAKSLFRDDVVGELPYIYVVWPDSSGWHRIANYEEGLTGLELDCEKYHVKVHTTK